ncbi:hypothetical protein DL96DRAFT_1571623, partial [Flagelloscypha sp. PMI_526]
MIMGSAGIGFSISLPEELLFRIFTLSIEDGYPQTISPLLFLSKSIYYWVLPQLYHTLDLRGEDAPKGGVHRKRLIKLSNPTHLSSLVRRVKCGSGVWSFSFAPFTSLTHLALCKRLGLKIWDAETIVQLSLEELIIENWADRICFRRAVKSDSPLCASLRRYGLSDPRWSIEASTWGHFLNLTHFLILYNGTNVVDPSYLQVLLSKGGFKCILYVLPWTDRDHPAFKLVEEGVDIIRDRRIAVLRDGPPHLDWNSEIKPPFWPMHENMWRQAEEMIEQNPNPEKFTAG